MLRKKLAKSQDEQYWDLMDAYHDRYGGMYTMESVTNWIRDNDLLPEPKINPWGIVTRRLRQAARRRRFKDPQGRTVRAMLPAKHQMVDENGNLFMEVVWDYLHKMSLDHALTAFHQRDENIEKQKLSATKDVQSCIDNNPNVKGHEDQFVFGFMVEESRDIVVEKIEETKPSDTELLSKKKPR
jgi:hypothetical protein